MAGYLRDLPFRHHLGLGLQNLETPGFQRRFSYVFPTLLFGRKLIIFPVVPKSYKHIRKGIRSATFTHLAPGDLIPKSIPGKKFIVKTLKKRPPPTRSQTWQEKHFGHGGVSGQAAIVRFRVITSPALLISRQDLVFICR